MMSYLLGIDVGTTRTAAAIARPNGGEVEVVSLGDRSSSVPSVLYLGDDGVVQVGEAAERRAMSSPDHIVREFKRRIGDPTPVVVGGRPWAPEELSAILVRWVIDHVSKREGTPPTRVAVTHPASWGAHKKERFGTALASHGMPVAFLAEPQAAALHYAAGERVEPGSTIAVYDFGGGTFDSAVVHKDTLGFGLVGRPEGLERLGGVDFDEIVFEHVVAGLPAAFRGLDDTDPAVLSAVATVRRECAEAKEALSSDTEVSIPVLTPAGQGSVRLHRSEFEAMIRPAVDETVGALRRAVSSAGLTPGQLSAILLVGGSSRIPLVGQLVSEQLGRPVAVDADPKNAIAMGAALSLSPVRVSMTDARAPRVPAPLGPSYDAIATPPVGVAMTAAPGAAVAGGMAANGMGGGGMTPSGAYRGDGGHPTQWMSGTGGHPRLPPPPPPRVALPDRPSVNLDGVSFTTPEERRASNPSPALLVTLGGALAAVVVLATVLLLPRQPAVNAGQTIPDPVTIVQTPSATPDVSATETRSPESGVTETPSTGGEGGKATPTPKPITTPPKATTTPAVAPTPRPPKPTPAPPTATPAPPTPTPSPPPTTPPPTTLPPPSTLPT